MEIILHILDFLAGVDIVPLIAGTVAGLYVQSALTDSISLRKLTLVIITSLTTGYFIGNAACHHWNLTENICSAVKFVVSVFALDILDTMNTVVEYIKKNPHELIAKILPKSKSNEKENESGPGN